MKTKDITQTATLPGSSKVLFEAWLDSKTHGAMISADAEISPQLGGAFSIWQGAITGRTLEIDEANHRIEQEWRYGYDDWPADKPSTLVITFQPADNGQTEVQLTQTGIPAQYADEIAKGWQEWYWQPMMKYFSNK